MEKLTYKQALKAVEAAVEVRGEDHVARVCEIFDAYEYDTTGNKLPVCIVGQALYELVGEAKFQQVEGGFVEAPAVSVGLNPTEKAEAFLSAAQAVQDNRQPWGTALKRAKEAVKDFGKTL